MTLEQFEGLIQKHWPQLLIGFDNRKHYTPNRLVKAIGIRVSYFEPDATKIEHTPAMLDELWSFILTRYLNASGAPAVQKLSAKFRLEKDRIAEAAKAAEMAEKYELGSSW